MSASLARLERKLGYTFKNQDRCSWPDPSQFAGRNNERLEFLGDAILNFVAGEALFERSRRPAKASCRACVRAWSRARPWPLARGFDLGEYLRLGSGELKSGGFRRESILADALEALIGAIYLDAGMDARAARPGLAGRRVRRPDPGRHQQGPENPPAEFLQSRSCELPRYEVVDIQGEPHCRTFFVECEVVC
jgi:ribonuclease-3